MLNASSSPANVVASPAASPSSRSLSTRPQAISFLPQTVRLGPHPGPIMRPSPQSQVPVVPDFHPPLRPTNFGGIGRPIVLRANHFQVKIPSCVLYHYDVAIILDKCP